MADLEFYLFFFFVLRLSHLAEKICKTKNKKKLWPKGIQLKNAHTQAGEHLRETSTSNFECPLKVISNVEL